MGIAYRKDIDGLRALAVLSVIIFHLGFLPNGYLGVDVFFVISGYLITGIVYKEVCENKFSILKFYERRLRRITPLVLFVTIVALTIGYFVMLPDDLENLAQSVFASNLMVNNILMYITSSDYWAVRNDYLPLMHTWSLGIEEQFYLLYPLIFTILGGRRKKYILPSIVLIFIVSFYFFLQSNNAAQKFYLFHFRVFELSFGGILAILKINKPHLTIFSLNKKYLLYILFSLLTILLLTNFIVSNDIKVVLVVLLTTGVLVLGDNYYNSNNLYKKLTTNKIVSLIGKISFSLYMWHQLVFAFSRYVFVENITLQNSIFLLSIVFVLSFISYHLIENPFRNRLIIKTKPFLFILTSSFILVLVLSLYIYSLGGIVRNVPELGIVKSNHNKEFNFFSASDNIHIQYNEAIRKLNIPFDEKNRSLKKVLVLGNSFGRDFTNVLLESTFNNQIQVRYSTVYDNKTELRDKIKNADFVFICSDYKRISEDLTQLNGIDIDPIKTFVVGTKDFGNSNGISYNKKDKDFKTYRVEMKKGILQEEINLKNQWRSRYISLLNLIADKEGKVLVFTPNGKYISQDTTHFTQYGASFFAGLLESQLKNIFEN